MGLVSLLSDNRHHNLRQMTIMMDNIHLLYLYLLKWNQSWKMLLWN